MPALRISVGRPPKAFREFDLDSELVAAISNYPDTFLARWVLRSDDMQAGGRPETLDRDPELFEAVLHYYRRGKVLVASPEMIPAIEQECDFHCIPFDLGTVAGADLGATLAVGHTMALLRVVRSEVRGLFSGWGDRVTLRTPRERRAEVGDKVTIRAVDPVKQVEVHVGDTGVVISVDHSDWPIQVECQRYSAGGLPYRGGWFRPSDFSLNAPEAGKPTRWAPGHQAEDMLLGRLCGALNDVLPTHACRLRGDEAAKRELDESFKRVEELAQELSSPPFCFAARAAREEVEYSCDKSGCMRCSGIAVHRGLFQQPAVHKYVWDVLRLELECPPDAAEGSEARRVADEVVARRNSAEERYVVDHTKAVIAAARAAAADPVVLRRGEIVHPLPAPPWGGALGAELRQQLARALGDEGIAAEVGEHSIRIVFRRGTKRGTATRVSTTKRPRPE